MVKVESFGRTKSGLEAFLYSLDNSKAQVVLTNFGASVVSVKVPDKHGTLTDVALGYDEILKYENDCKYLGASVGRCSNRINNGKITINGTDYQLTINDGENHLHGGIEGFNKKIWKADIIKESVRFTYISPDGEEGYPYELKTEITYTLNDTTLEINFKAASKGDTACAFTNHSYFNLNGYDSGNILEQKVQIFADYFTRNDKNSLPTGEILPVQDTPMDFRTPKPIGKDINSDYEQILFAKGFDNNWVINRESDANIVKAAEAFSEKSGIKLEVFTDLPGVQLYSGNYLDGAENGKNNKQIKNRYAFCLECQYFPNAFAHKNFPQPILKAGEVYNKTIIYNFGLI